MTSELPLEKKFSLLVEICRASHFAWREAALRCCPEVDVQKLVNEMWKITGEQTGQAYLKHLDPSRSISEQVAASVVFSSQCMGEDAHLLEGDEEGVWFVKHDSCPWHRWHEKTGLLPEDRAGCDCWFDATIHAINEKLGGNVRFETMSALPDGDDCCLRRIWEEK